MTEEIMQLMEERRKYKNNITNYKGIHKVIQRKIRKAKQKKTQKKYHEIEELMYRTQES